MNLLVCQLWGSPLKHKTMQMIYKQVLVLLLLFSGLSINAQEIIKPDPSKEVILYEDGTWKYDDSPISEDKNDQGQFIAKMVDEMTDKVYYYFNEGLVYTNGGEGFRVSVSIEGTDDNSIKGTGLSAKVVGLKCVEKVKLYFLFVDGTKMELESWNKFNCEGNAWYSLNNKQATLLSSKRIDKIRVENGRNYQSITADYSGQDEEYFIISFKKLDEKDIRLKKVE